MSKIVAKKVIVSGKVQGVAYRISTQKMAKSLALKGWVKNLRTGSVEINVMGLEDRVLQLIQWTHIGPPSAEVKSVFVTEIDLFDSLDFKIER